MADPAFFQAATPSLVLASGSLTRLTLLQDAGLVVQARPAAIDEDLIKRSARAEGAGPDDTALLLADFKARRHARDDLLVIGADQILVCEDRWFDKPADLAGARTHLAALRGKSHVLHTAVCIYRGTERVWHHIARPRLMMRSFSDAFLDAYLAAEGTLVLSSVGAYRLENAGIHLFERIEGEHSAILGLPMLAVLEFLRQHGVLLR